MRIFAAICITLAVFVSHSLALEGTALVIEKNDDAIKLIDASTGSRTTVQTRQNFHTYNTLSGPCFSPDGKRIAFMRYQLNTREQDGSHVWIMDNDGGNVTHITKCFASKGSAFECSWAGNGYIYWSEDGDKVYRVGIATKQAETVISLGQMSGEKPTRIDNLKVSLDGNHGACMVNGSSQGAFGFDFAARTSRSYGGGCQGTVSPNGELVTNNTTGADGYSYHQLAYIKSWSDGSIVHRITPDNMSSPGGSKRFVFHRFSHSSNDYVVYSGEDALSGKGYVCDIRTNESTYLGECTPYDFWAGPLPAPPAAAPRIALDRERIELTSLGGAVPAAQEVNVSNEGVGTLGAVSVEGAPAWLTVIRSGTGNSQVLTNTVDPSRANQGVNTATMTVSGGDAGNSVNYTVVLTVGSSILAPSNLTVRASGETSVALSWTDNSDSEEGFAVERRTGSGVWQQIGTVPQDGTEYTDSDAAVGSEHHYRVRAYAGPDSSAYSNVATIELQATRSITLVSPSGGETWAAGNDYHIKWTTQSVTQVDLMYSTDGGKTLLLMVDRSVNQGDPEWGDFEWTVPKLPAAKLLVVIQEYSNPEVSASSGEITLVQSAAVPDGIAAGRVPHSMLRCTRQPGGMVQIDYAVGPGVSSVSIWAPGGRQVERFGGQVVGGVQTVFWDARGTAAGIYLVRARTETKVLTTRVPVR